MREAHPQPMNGVLDLVLVAPSHVVRQVVSGRHERTAANVQGQVTPLHPSILIPAIFDRVPAIVLVVAVLLPRGLPTARRFEPPRKLHPSYSV